MNIIGKLFNNGILVEVNSSLYTLNLSTGLLTKNELDSIENYFQPGRLFEMSTEEREKAQKLLDKQNELFTKNAVGDKYNPYRDSKGRFTDGLTIKDIEKMVASGVNKEKIDEAKERLRTRLNNKYKGFDITDLEGSTMEGVVSTDYLAHMQMTRKQYYKEHKGVEGDVYEMAPKDYLDLLIKDGPYTDHLDISNRSDREKIDKYSEAMENGERFPVPLISYDENGEIDGQEGIHRVIAALNNGYEKIPVGITYQTKKKPESIKSFKSALGVTPGETSEPRDYNGMSPNEFSTAVQEDYGHQAEWTEEDRKAIDAYTATDYRDINKFLSNTTKRNMESEDDEDVIYGDPEEIKEMIAGIEKSMKNKLLADTDLYRGYATSEELVEGSTIDYAGFSSSSFFEHKGVSFAKSAARFGSPDKRPIVLKIKAKKGQVGVIPQLQGDGIGLRGVEAEYLLPKGLSFIIKRITDKGDYEEAEVEIV